MAAKLTVNLLIERGEKIEPFNGFTEVELAAMSERLSKSMSTYYTKHSDELLNLRT